MEPLDNIVNYLEINSRSYRWIFVYAKVTFMKMFLKFKLDYQLLSQDNSLNHGIFFYRHYRKIIIDVEKEKNVSK